MLKMRKVILFTVFIMIFTISVSYLPTARTIIDAINSRKTMTIVKRETHITIDGNLSDWKNAKFAILGDIDEVFPVDSMFRTDLSIEPETVWKGPEDLSGRVSLMWDDAYLYVGAEIVDDDPFINEAYDQYFYEGDCFEIYLGFSDSKGEKFAPDDFQFAFHPGTKETAPYIWFAKWFWDGEGKGVRDDNPKGAKYVVNEPLDFSGYVVEAAIPWANFGPCRLTPGKVVGFDVGIYDADLSGVSKKRIYWSGTDANWLKPRAWGQAIVN